MVFQQVIFLPAALAAIAGAAGVVLLRNAFFSVLALVAHLLALATLFLLLRAEFVAVAQIVVYVGAVMVLYVFVAAYVGSGAEPLGPAADVARRLGPLFAAALLAEVSIAFLGSGLTALDTQGANLPSGYGSPGQIGTLFLTDFLIAFEAASYLLLVAAVGAVILARRREGLEPTGTISVGDLFSTTDRTGTLEPGEQGTMLEAGSSPRK